ncbi:efflux RND transporter periplasmic adaptor subunit [Nitrospirillum sp. BR 11163]|uniref:efflux RND transporter periplasmic adaptor subunit n=1 Tax=Nitrospirillum sp. BR 11163 TaxID=3104323 RepID=UPI002AFE6269|nr:efflux RND transporter periplasmic adaptor subunit [Nitrospirillum sp. BR 11163]MEA1672831.1 efflux RND transporter periplasmic adaptor subunit [Nitrospirillum sp. BR 11163]
MSDLVTHHATDFVTQQQSPKPSATKPGAKAWVASMIALGVVAGAVIAGPQLMASPTLPAGTASPPSVAVSLPLQRDVDGRLELLGQFSAVQKVELRAQVGGTLTQIGFKDGDIVHKGDLLFQIDPTPYQIRLSQAEAALASARSRLELANRELTRADALQKTGAGSVQSTDQKNAEQRAAQAAVDAAQAAIRDAQFDLDHTRVTAPFTGRVGTHLVSVGNLVAGSRAATSPTTLLATIVSTDTLYLNFDMSEADYMRFLRERQAQGGVLANKVAVALADETAFNHQGTLDFVDNSLDRSSGTIHLRATVPDTDGLLTPGGFARVRVQLAPPAPALLVPDASVLPDQSDHVVLTVGPDNVVTPKQVTLGDLRDGLRVIRSGLSPSDRVIVGGIPTVRPGATVAPQAQAIKTATN